MAEARGVRDDLTLAEIECSIDLLDAELSSQPEPASIIPTETGDVRIRREIRLRLVRLAARMQRLPA